MAGVIQIVHPFRDGDFAGAGRLKLQEGHRKLFAQRDVLGNLVFAQVSVVVGLFHSPQRQAKAFTRQKAFVKVVPAGVAHEMFGQVPAFDVEGALRLISTVKRQFIHPCMQRRSFLLQPEVKRVAGELVAQEILHFGDVLHGLALVVQVAQGGVAAAQGTKAFPLDLVDLDRMDIDKVLPFILAPVPAVLGQTESGDGVDDIGGGSGNGARGGKDHRQFLARRQGDEVAGKADIGVGDQVHRLTDCLDHVAGGAQRRRGDGEGFVLCLARQQAGSDQVLVVGEVGQGDGLVLFNRLNLPVGVAPLILADLQHQVVDLAFVHDAQLRQVFGVALLIGRQQLAAKAAQFTGQFLCPADQNEEAIRAGRTAPERLVEAEVAIEFPAFSHRVVPEIGHVDSGGSIADAARVEAGMDQPKPVAGAVVKAHQSRVERRTSQRHAGNGVGCLNRCFNHRYR